MSVPKARTIVGYTRGNELRSTWSTSVWARVSRRRGGVTRAGEAAGIRAAIYLRQGSKARNTGEASQGSRCLAAIALIILPCRKPLGVMRIPLE